MRRFLPFIALVLALLPGVAVASGGAESLAQPLLALALFLGAAKLGGHLALKLNQPAVLGELLAGIVLGNLKLVGWDPLGFALHDPVIAALGELGVILLLFEVGLESTLAQMAKVGRSALVVAVVGVIVPMILGYGVGVWLLPEHSWYVHLFLGAALTATSVGITARVLQDIGQSQTPEARVILGAAVIDDVLGLIILATVSGVIAAANEGTTLSAGPVGLIVLKAVVFLGGAVGLGSYAVPRLLRGAAHLKGGGVLLGVSLAFCFGLSYLASWMGLAPIVGAFAAGLILETAHYKPFTDKGEYPLEKLIHPVAQFLAPVFFVLMGLRVDLTEFLNPAAIGLAAALSLAAVLGKQVCGLGIVDRGIRRLPVGIGMIPRGEVGLIFASIGRGLSVQGEPVIDASTYTAIVMMVLVTTLVTPPVLAWSLRRGTAGGQPAPVTTRPSYEAEREDVIPAD